jgi:ABC-2 type transport system permease protein
MILTLLGISRTSLRRDRVAQIMVYVLPVVFFSIFASVFGRANMSATSRIAVAVADEDRSTASGNLITALKADPTLDVRETRRVKGATTGAPLDRAGAEALVRNGDLPVAVVIPHGWGEGFPRFDGSGTPVDVLADVSDPVASHLIVGLLQRAAARTLQGAFGGGTGTATKELSLVPTHVVDLLGEKRDGGRMVSFYAAGIAVMFLLFSCSAAGGVLLDEVESGTLERVLNTNVGMGGLLAGKWLHVTLLGVSQIVVMFVWGAAVFHLDLVHHLPGFLVMTVATAAAAAAFGILLATLCHTRQQLSGISTLVILTMSALGGSMFPRFLMSATMQKIGLVTFNAWALDGFIKVFWRELPLTALWPQLAVLAALAVTFLTLARAFARRWETA